MGKLRKRGKGKGGAEGGGGGGAATVSPIYLYGGQSAVQKPN